MSAPTATGPAGSVPLAPTPASAGRTAASATQARPALRRYYTWQLPVRITHWLIAISIVVLSATGFYIGNPFIVVPGEARYSFVMGTVKAVHSYFAIVFTLSVLSRILWMFLGNRYSRWDQFIPVSRERRKKLVETFTFYIFLHTKPPDTRGHNPLAGLAYSLVFVLYLTAIVTGLALYGMSAHVDSWMRIFGGLLPWLGGAQTARWIHHAVMWLLLGFAVHHVYSAWLMAAVEKTGTMDSIFSGYKFREPTPEDEEEEKS
ncbi:MAG: Ni/Fe-hydrogenase, b-type cytochrome subunit [Acidobacteriota bacterium]|nr:Ni/Fe-hydrogenase, b-type cytochrome subunit [Acidobacteriota bacterium]